MELRSLQNTAARHEQQLIETKRSAEMSAVALQPSPFVTPAGRPADADEGSLEVQAALRAEVTELTQVRWRQKERWGGGGNGLKLCWAAAD